jgi:hypothetical protein
MGTSRNSAWKERWRGGAPATWARQGKFGERMKVIHIWAATSTNPKIRLPFGSPVGGLFLTFYIQFGFGSLNRVVIEDSLRS